MKKPHYTVRPANHAAGVGHQVNKSSQMLHLHSRHGCDWAPIHPKVPQFDLQHFTEVLTLISSV